MPTINQIGIPNGKAPSKPSANIIVGSVTLDANGQAQFSTAGGDGSSRYDYNWQTIFLDAGAAAGNVTVECIGTLHAFRLAKGTQAYLPVACPEGSFMLKFSGTAADKIPFSLFDIMLPSIVWTA